MLVPVTSLPDATTFEQRQRILQPLLIRSPRPFRWDHVDFTDTRTSLYYWARDRFSLPPPVARPRIKRLKAYRDLYNSDYSPLLLPDSETIVKGNEFRQTPDGYADFLMAFPPTFDPPLPDEFDMSALMTELTCAIVDMIRYGFALLYSEPGTPAMPGGIHCWNPIDWYPAEGPDRAAYVQTQMALREDGRHTTQRILTATILDQTMEVHVGGVTSGKGVDRQMTTEPMIREAFPVQVCALPPLVDGYWGTSLYDEMIPVVAELTRRASGMSTILRDHERPHIVPVRDPRENAPINYAEDGTADIDVLAANLDDQDAEDDGQKYIIPPFGYTDFKYLVYEAQQAAAFNQRQMMQDQLATITGLNSALFGVMRPSSPRSGTALRATFAGFYAKCEMIKSVLVPRLTAALALAGMPDRTIEWPNPLDQLSVVRTQQVPMDDEDMDDESGDEALSGGGEESSDDESEEDME